MKLLSVNSFKLYFFFKCNAFFWNALHYFNFLEILPKKTN